MTKEQIDECEKLGIKHAAQIGKEFTEIELENMPYLMSQHSFAIGFTAGVESEKKRAQVLVESLERYFNISLGSYLLELEETLEKYQKGDE